MTVLAEVNVRRVISRRLLNSLSKMDYNASDTNLRLSCVTSTLITGLHSIMAWETRLLAANQCLNPLL